MKSELPIIELMGQNMVLASFYEANIHDLPWHIEQVRDKQGLRILINFKGDKSGASFTSCAFNEISIESDKILVSRENGSCYYKISTIHSVQIVRLPRKPRVST